jgi:hypothetical protein
MSGECTPYGWFMGEVGDTSGEVTDGLDVKLPHPSRGSIAVAAVGGAWDPCVGGVPILLTPLSERATTITHILGKTSCKQTEVLHVHWE